MNRSPLQLKHYFFTRIEIEPVKGYVQSDEEGMYPNINGHDLSCSFAYAEPSAEHKIVFHGVRLTIALNGQAADTLPYKATIGLEGVFEVVKDWPDGKVFDLVAINGSSILYSVAREILMTLTARFENGPVLLPTVSFQDFRDLRKGEASGGSESDEVAPITAKEATPVYAESSSSVESPTRKKSRKK